MSRTRNFATIVYQESAPVDWLDIIGGAHVDCFVSPCHDKDVNKKTGEIKKSHYHVLVQFQSVKTDVQAKAFFTSFGGVGCEAVNSFKNYARYLCHLDDDDKEHYSTDDVVTFGTLDYEKVIEVDVPKEDVLAEIVDYILDNQQVTFAHIIHKARYNKKWFKCLCSSGSAFLIREYLYSLHIDCNIEKTPIHYIDNEKGVM